MVASRSHACMVGLKDSRQCRTAHVAMCSVASMLPFSPYLGAQTLSSMSTTSCWTQTKSGRAC